jgi:hypothetical protein
MRPTSEETEDVSIALKKTREDDSRKGQAVKTQLVRYNTRVLKNALLHFRSNYGTLY